MDNSLKGIAGLVAATDVEARCAALLILTHLKASDPPVVRAAGDALKAKNVVVRDFALGYFEQVRPREGITYLLPFLDHEDDPVRRRVVSMLTAHGQAAIAAAKKLAKAAPRRRLNAIIDLCAAVRTSAALDLLFDLLAGEDFDASRATCDALTTTVPSLDARARADVFARTDRLAAGTKDRRSALIAAAKLFGALGDARARKRLSAMLHPEQPPPVRTHALAALARCLRGHSLTATEIKTLLPLLDEADESGFLRPAVHLLEDQALDRSYLTQLNRLAESPQPLVKRFAVHKLGEFDSGSVVKTLIGYLTDDSYARRDEAASSLKKLPAARSSLMKQFLSCEDEREAWTLADILLVHDRSWKRDAVAALWSKLESALEKREDRLYTAFFHFLNTLESDWVAEQIRLRAERLRKSKKFALASKWLTLLKGSPAFDPETRFALVVAELKSHRHVFAAPVRRHDPALELLAELASTPFPAAERLRKERVLAPEDLFYVAFNFAEGGAEDKATARELLEHLARKHPRTKVGKASKNKLKLLPAG